MLGFEKNPIGSFLYAVEYSIKEFGSDPSKEKLFVEAYDFICRNIEQVLASYENC